MGGGSRKQVVLTFGICLGMVAIVCFAGVAVAGQFGGEIAAIDQPGPIAEAGLDMSVDQYETVYLDAGGSTAQAGELIEYDWEIERPDGTTMAPECAECQRPRFVPELVGTYTVTVTVTDSHGQQASDTLYVDVSDREPPTADLTGPLTAKQGAEETVELAGTPGTYSLLSVNWQENGRLQGSSFLDEEESERYTTALPLPGRYTIDGTVVDRSGLAVQASHQIEVGDEYSHFEVAITETTAPVEGGEPLSVTTTVYNNGTLADRQPIVLETPDEVVQAETNVSLEPDEETTVTLEWDTCDEFYGEVAVLSQDDGDRALVEVFDGACDTDEGIEIDSFDAPTEALEGETVETTAVVRNTANETQTQVVALSDIYDRYASAGVETVTLSPEETKELTLKWETTVGEAGSGQLTVQTGASDQSQPFELLAQAIFEVQIETIERPEERSDDDLTAAIGVTNTGSATETQSISLETDDLHIDAEELELGGGERETVTLRWSDAVYADGTHTLVASSADDSAEQTVEIAEPDPEEESGDGTGGGRGGGGTESYQRYAQLTTIETSSNPLTPDNTVSTELGEHDNTIEAIEYRSGSVQYDGQWVCDPSLSGCSESTWPDYPTLDSYTESATATNTDTQWNDVPIYVERDGGTEPAFSIDDPQTNEKGNSGSFEVISQADYDSANEQNFNGDSVSTTIEYEIPEEEDDDDEDDGGSGWSPPSGGSGGDNDDEAEDDDGEDDEDGGDDNEQDPCDINPDNPDCNGGDDDEEDDNDGYDPCPPGTPCIEP